MLSKICRGFVVSVFLAVAVLGSFAETLPIALGQQRSPTQIADQQMTVAGSYANLRAKPTTASRVLARLPKGTKVTVIGKTSSRHWVHVMANGKSGYISAKLLK